MSARYLAVVTDPLLVEIGSGVGQSACDGLAADLRGPLPVGPMQLGAAAVWLAAAVVGAHYAAGGDEAEVRDVFGESR
jgi:hypothetical protein